MSTPREEAWRRLHDPSTDAGALADIARAHPEFAEAIRRHPNCYEALRAWADAVHVGEIEGGSHGPAPTEPAQAQQPSAAGAVRQRRVAPAIVLGSVLSGVLVVGGGLAVAATLFVPPPPPGPVPVEAAASASASPGPLGQRRLDALPVYIGEELDLFLLDAPQLTPYIPDAANGRLSDELLTIGEGEGVHTDPASCLGWIIPDEGVVTGARALQWTDVGYTSDSMTVRQFPTPELAEAWVQPYISGECAHFRFGQIDPLVARIDSRVVAAVDDRVFAVRLERGDGSSARTLVVGRESNVVVTIDTDLELSDADGSTIAALVNEKMILARAAVTAKIGYR